MKITLPPQHIAWLERQVAEGRYASASECIVALIIADADSKFRSQPDQSERGEQFTPNAETIAAMQEARAGQLEKFANFEDLLANLTKDD